MPEFSWAQVPEQLARELVRELALDEAAAPAAALAASFGTTPGVDFVKVAWPVLPDQWLPADAGARADVVGRLRAAGLGDHETAPRGKAAQLAYLRTCRNSPRLRQTVLDRFLELSPAADRRPERASGGSEATEARRATSADSARARGAADGAAAVPAPRSDAGS